MLGMRQQKSSRFIGIGEEPADWEWKIEFPDPIPTNPTYTNIQCKEVDLEEAVDRPLP